MRTGVAVIIPALNEQKAICYVLKEIPASIVDEVIVVDNGSTDRTSEKAAACGATVLQENKRGYGHACLKGIEYLKQQEMPPEIIVFLDADYSDYPEEMEMLIKPIRNENFDMVIGSRALGNRETGSMTFAQVFGNWLATFLIRMFFKVRFTDLGPFRAIRFEKLIRMDMQDKTYGWTVEMQLKAAKMGLRNIEVPVTYRKRIGFSKVSGTVKGTLMAGYKILWTIIKHL